MLADRSRRERGEGDQPTLSRDTAISGTVDLDALSVTEEGTTRINSIFAQFVFEKVASNWELVIADNKDAAGLDFFCRILTANPSLLKLFSLPPELTDEPQRLRRNKGLQRHASTAMDFVGKVVKALRETIMKDLFQISER